MKFYDLEHSEKFMIDSYYIIDENDNIENVTKKLKHVTFYNFDEKREKQYQIEWIIESRIIPTREARTNKVQSVSVPYVLFSGIKFKKKLDEYLRDNVSIKICGYKLNES